MRRFTLLMCVCVAVSACKAPAPPATDPIAERAAVERAITQWFDAGLATSDTAVIRRGLSAGAAILEDSVWYDREGFIKLVQSWPALVGGSFTARYALSDWRTDVHGDVAWTSLRNRAVVTPQAGPPMSLDWRETAVLTKVDGAWLIDRYHSAPVRK